MQPSERCFSQHICPSSSPKIFLVPTIYQKEFFFAPFVYAKLSFNVALSNEIVAATMWTYYICIFLFLLSLWCHPSRSGCPTV
jgi:hypothetical protein